MNVEYQLSKDGDTIYADFPADGEVTVRLSAKEIRLERTGVHAFIAVAINGRFVNYETFNIGKERDGRGTFVRSTLAKVSEDRSAVVRHLLEKVTPLSYMVDAFCLGLYSFYQERYEPKILQVEKKPGPPFFYLPPYVMRGAGTVIFGPPGAGKSAILQLMAASIDHGANAIWPVQQGRVLFINLERSWESLERRWPRVFESLGMPIDTPVLVLQARGKRLSEVMPRARRFVSDFAIDVVILDSLSRAGYFGSLKDDDTANTIIDALNALCSTWVAIGHTPRQEDGHVFGSQMFDAGVDIAIKLASQKTDTGLGVMLEVTKANDMKFPRPTFYKLDFDDDGLRSARSAAASELPLLNAGKTDVLGDIIGILRDNGKMTAPQIADALGYSRAWVSRLVNEKTDTFVKLERSPEGQYFGLAYRE